MELPRSPLTGFVMSLFFFTFATTSYGHNITRILAKHPEFSTFNHYLTLTHLAPEINSRETITVCAVDNAGMADLLSKHLPIFAIKNVLSLHILVDYFGTKKLHQINKGTALVSTMFQATGSAPGTTGFVNITVLKGGKVGFGAEDNNGNLDATYVKSIQELPYKISVIQISKILPSPEAEAPTPAPAELNFTAIMAKKGCKNFADLLTSTNAVSTFQDNAVGGLTIFCPGDEAVKTFAPKYKNLTAEGKLSLLLYHGMPVFQSMQMLKSSNGLVNTLATDGAKKYDFTVQNDGELVTLQTKVVTAKITGSLINEDPLAVYSIDKVLLPKELFKKALVEAPAPAPEADAPKKKKKKKKDAAEAPEPFAPDAEPSDAEADTSGGVRFNGGGLVGLVLGVWMIAGFVSV